MLLKRETRTPSETESALWQKGGKLPVSGVISSHRIIDDGTGEKYRRECLHHLARVGRRDDKELDAGLAATILPCEYLLGICPR